MTYLRIFGALFALFAVFLLGLSLTWRDFPGNPTGFPLNRTFVAVSLNDGRFDYERMPQLPLFEVRRTPMMRYRASGNGGCNAWNSDIALAPDQSVVWKDISVTARTCRARDIEEPYLKTLLQTTRWRTESGTLILENDSDTLRFQLAPGRRFFGW